VEQELWQREEKGLIGILPVRDAAEIKPVGPTVSEGNKLFFLRSLIFVHYWCRNIDTINQ